MSAWGIVFAVLLVLWSVGVCSMAWRQAQRKYRLREMADPIQRLMQDLADRGEWELGADYDAGRYHPLPKQKEAA